MNETENKPEAGGIAVDRLRTIVERIERLEEERKGLARDIYAEAKSAGFDVTVIRRIIKAREKTPSEVDEQENLFDVYRHALGM